MMRLTFRVLPPLIAAWLGVAGPAFAEEPPLAAEAPRRVERPAPVSIDIDTGARTVIVPPGCTSTTRPNGQIVLLCPFAAPDESAAPTPVVRSPSPPRPFVPLQKEWYGWQILVADGASIAAGIGVGLATNGDGNGLSRGLGTTAAGYVLAAPLVHWANGQVGPGFGSMSIRVGAPLVMAAWGAIAGAVLGDQDGVGVGAGIGAGAGVLGAIVVDAALLAQRPVDEKERERVSGARKNPVIQWMPTANYDSRRAATTVGLAGTF